MRAILRKITRYALFECLCAKMCACVCLKQREKEIVRECMCVWCVCVCVCVRETKGEMRVHARESNAERENVHIHTHVRARTHTHTCMLSFYLSACPSIYTLVGVRDVTHCSSLQHTATQLGGGRDA